MLERPSFTVGIEEEYLVVDRVTRDLVDSPAPGFMERCAELTGERSTPEYLQCQVEIGTAPHARIADARADLMGLRRAIAEAATEYGYAPIAASTHPFAQWRQQHHTPKPRYDELRDAIGQPVRRLLICGCHVHCCIEDDDLRIDLMNQAAYFLPHLLALSCSSPFWEGEDTGLASYRLTVFDALPRTGAAGPAGGARRIPPAGRCSGRRRCHRGRDQDMVGHSPLGQIPDAGATGHGCLRHGGRGP